MFRTIPPLSRILLLAALVFTVAGCQTALPNKVSPQAATQIKTIGIITAVGKEFTIFSFGLTIFSNDDTKANVESWQIDRLIEEKTRAVLEGRYEIVTVDHNRRAFESPDDIALGEVRGRLYGNAKPLSQIVSANVGGPPVDAYVVITREIESYVRQPMVGLGILNASGPLVRNVKLYALYRITLVDGRTFAEIASAPALSHVKMSFNPFDFGQTVPLQGPFKEVDESWIPSGPDFAKSPLGSRLRDSLTDLIAKSLPDTLATLGLINQK